MGLNQPGDPAFNRNWTLLGTPCVSVPGLRGRQGGHIGVQLIGSRGADGRVLDSGNICGIGDRSGVLGATFDRKDGDDIAQGSASEWRVGVLVLPIGRHGCDRVGALLRHRSGDRRDQRHGRSPRSQLAPIAYDPRGDYDEYRRLASRMLLDDDINVIFGCSSSSSRKAVLPVVERTNGLLWYCSIYEGFEYSPNVIYTGAVPNQNSMQLAAYLLRNRGLAVLSGRRRLHLSAGIQPHHARHGRAARRRDPRRGLSAHRRREAQLLGGHCVRYNASSRMSSSRRWSAKACALSIACTASMEWIRSARPIASLTMAEEEVRLIGAELCEGHITSATYFNSLENESNRRFIELWRDALWRSADEHVVGDGLQPGAPLRARSGTSRQPRYAEAGPVRPRGDVRVARGAASG